MLGQIYWNIVLKPQTGLFTFYTFPGLVLFKIPTLVIKRSLIKALYDQVSTSASLNKADNLN